VKESCLRFDLEKSYVSFPVEKPERKGSQSHAKLGQRWSSRAEDETLALNYQCGTETILLVDDEESLRTVVVDLLSQLGYRLLSAASGQEAIEVAREFADRIDLLLTDVVMDGLPGPELAEVLLQSRPEMKVVYISGFADGSIAPNCVLKPGTVLVQKPFTIRFLSAKLREVLDKSGS